MAIGQDLRHGARQMIKRPGFTLAAVLTLALGIGANTSMFSVVHAVMLRSPPYPEPERLVILHVTGAEGRAEAESLPWSYPLFEAFRDRAAAFTSVAAFTDWNPTLNLTGTEVPERVRVEFVSADYFLALGVRAQRGRTFLLEEDRAPEAAPVALLSHGLWRGVFGADSSVVGREITLNGRALSVVGVLPAGFDGLSGNAEVFLPMMMAPAFLGERRLEMRSAFWHSVVARLAPGVSLAGARAELDLTAAAVAESFELPGGARLGLEAQELADWRVDPEIRAPLVMLLAAVMLVLLIACVNIANLMMSRAITRQRDLAVRAALGAGRAALLRLLLVESVLLALVGGAAGLLLALWGTDLLGALKPAGLTSIDFAAVAIDRAVLVFNLAVSVAAGLLFGIMPALQVYRSGLYDALREGGDRSFRGIMDLRRPSPRSLLVAGEIALATVLLIAAGLALRSFSVMRGVDLGFRPGDLLSAQVSLPRQEYSTEAAVTFLAGLRDRVAGAPGVGAVAVAYCLPLSDTCDRARLSKEADPPDEEAPPRDVVVNLVDETYFRTLGIPILRGRDFEPRDRDGSPRVAVINMAAAHAYWPGEESIGSRIRLSLGWPEGEYAEVVGVVGDVQYGKLDEEVAPAVYLPFRQFSYHANFFLARADGVEPGELAEPLRAAVLALDPKLPVYDVRTMRARVADSSSRARFSASLLTAFGVLALMLAAVGVYAVMAFAVSGRIREIGLRMAVGARSSDVMRLVLRDSLLLTLVGLAIGLAASLVLTRMLAVPLYGVAPTDPLTFAGATALLALTALGAGYLPAWRAARVDPLVALRHE